MADGTALTLHVAAAGMLLAEASLFAEAYHCDAVARKAAVVACVPRSAFLASLRDRPDAALALIAANAREIQSQRTRIEILRLRRVADRLEAWLDLYGEPEKGEWVRVANAIGVSQPALYRELARRRKPQRQPQDRWILTPGECGCSVRVSGGDSARPRDRANMSVRLAMQPALGNEFARKHKNPCTAPRTRRSVADHCARRYRAKASPSSRRGSTSGMTIPAWGNARRSAIKGACRIKPCRPVSSWGQEQDQRTEALVRITVKRRQSIPLARCNSRT